VPILLICTKDISQGTEQVHPDLRGQCRDIAKINVPQWRGKRGAGVHAPHQLPEPEANGVGSLGGVQAQLVLGDSQGALLPTNAAIPDELDLEIAVRALQTYKLNG
jgi:hypothetical protein